MAAPERQTVQQKRRAPEYFEYRPAPLRVTSAAPVLPVACSATAPTVDMVMYDFGAILAELRDLHPLRISPTWWPSPRRSAATPRW